MHRLAIVVALCTLLEPVTLSQTREPIIDMHLHALAANAQGPPPMGMCTPIDPMPGWDPIAPFPQMFVDVFKKPPCANPIWSPTTDVEVMNRTLDVMKRHNVIGVLSGPAARVDAWMAADSARFIPALLLDAGQAGAPSPDIVRQRHAQKRLSVLGEVTNQYSGLLPDDPRMEPYWRLAEELDIPVAYHIGPGPPGAIYLGSPNYRARLHSALTMEEVLVKHPKLRVSVMHAGFPMLDDMLAVLYAHPQVYVDVGIIVYGQPRPAFYRYLQGLVDSGFGKRVMFGSDQMVWPEALERAIAVINEATFLSAAQKRDIFYNNAARFLRLSQEDIARHRGM
jgi:predicted TIM-barrel fold metal-dependent hydrolase